MRYLCKPTNGNLGTRSAVAAIRSCVLTRTSMSCRAAAAAHLMSKSSVSRWRRKYAHPTELLKLPSDTSFVQQRNCVIAKNRKNCFGTTELTVLSEVIEEHPKASLRQLTRFFMNKLNSKDDTQQQISWRRTSTCSRSHWRHVHLIHSTRLYSWMKKISILYTKRTTKKASGSPKINVVALTAVIPDHSLAQSQYGLKFLQDSAVTM